MTLIDVISTGWGGVTGRVVEEGGRHPSRYIEKVGGGEDGRVKG